MGVKISEATPKGSVAGTELFAVSDSLTAKSVTGENIKDYVIDSIEAITAAVAVDGSDEVFINKAGATLQPVDVDLVCQHGIDTMWGKAAETVVDDADILLLKDGGSTEKTVTAAILATYMLAELEPSILDVSDLSSHTPVAASYFLVVDGTTAKQCQFSDLTTAIYADLDTYVTGLDAVVSTQDTDVFYTVAGGSTEKKVTLAQIVAHLGSPTTGPGSTTENNVPQWNATTNVLKNGLSVSTASFYGAGASTAIATTEAIELTLSTLVYSETDLGVALADADLILVNDGNSSAVQRKTNLTSVWTWILTKLTAVTDLSSYSWFLDDDTMSADDATKCASQQSIKAYVDNNVYAGLLTTLDIDGGTDIGGALADADLIIVDDGASGTNRKSAISRLWTYIQGKLGSLYTAAGTGITGGTGTICVMSAEKVGNLYKTTIVIDLTGLRSTAADDIIGVDGTSDPCYICQITQALSGTIFLGRVTCGELPAGGTDDIDIYSATEATGTEDDAISGLTYTQLINGGTWTAGEEQELTAYPAADEYIYIVAGATLDADYTGGKFIIELWGN